MARGLHPDKRTEIALTGCARQHALAGTSDPEAIAELKLIAHGRADLLAEAAGRTLGGWLASPGTQHPATAKAGALLVMAGADPDLIARHFDEARALAGRSHGTHNIGGAPNGE